MSTSPTEIVIRRLDAAEAHVQLDGLAAVLADCVAGGASVSYMEQFSHDDARVAERLMERAEAEARAEGKTLLVLDAVTGDNAERLHTRLGWTRVDVFPGYALYPDGRPCDTTVFWKAL